LALFGAVFGLVLGCDRLLKFLALSRLHPGQPVRLLPFLDLNLTLNTGAAFGLLPNARWLLAALGLAVSVAGFYVGTRLSAKSAGGPGLLAAVALVSAGATGNLIDRVFCGHVVDFVDLKVWPVFNLADSAIVVGSLYLAWRCLTWRQPGEG